jgi:Pyruvate/2-oxoacid:ferredoxin oxidoreductase delta subunit
MAPTPKQKVVSVASAASVASMPARDESPKIRKEMKQRDPFGFMKKRAPPDLNNLNIEVLNHEATKYSRLLGWQNSGTVLLLPMEQQKELANLCKLLDTAIVEKEWSRAETIQCNVDRLKQSLGRIHRDIEEAKGALKESLLAYDYYIHQGKYVMAGKWDLIAVAGKAVLDQYFQHEAEREEVERELRKRKTQATVELDASSSKQEDDEPREDDLEEEKEEEEEGPRKLMNPFDAPEKSHATLLRKEKTSVATGSRARKTRKFDKFMSRQEFDIIMDAPWQRKDKLGARKSGPNKNGHALSYVAVNGQINCEACSVYVPRKRSTQHINGITHEKKLKSLKEATSVATGIRATRKLDNFMSRQDFDIIMNAPWQRKNKLGAIESGPNKNGHALSYAAANGQINCEACSVHVPGKWITRHIVGTAHVKMLKSLKERTFKTSVATGILAQKTRKLDKFMSRQEFDIIMDAPWQRKDKLGARKSGPNKNGHALSYVAVNGQINCEACSVYVPRRRITQHIIGTTHEKKLKFHKPKEETSVATGIRAKKTRKLDKFMSRQEFDSIMNAPWQKRTKFGAIESGPNKDGHALSYVAVNGQINCEACSVHVPRKRITQHIVGTTHEKKLKSLEERNSKRQNTLQDV